ncbi:MAG: hypothetical protein K8S98_09500 [Planctomycetes bacterium]|nr:hypothetical protein [Planctomycetota bacterium]
MHPTTRFVFTTTLLGAAWTFPAHAQVTSAAYDVRLAANTGMTTGDGVVLADIDTQLSINDKGEIAFTGVDAGGSKAFAIRNGVTKGITFFSATRVFNGAAINNASPIAQVATRDRFAGAPPLTFERKWPVDGSQALVKVGESPDDFDSGLLFVDLNDSGVMAFTALTAGSSLTTLFAGSSQPPTSLVSFPGVQTIRPQISNDGRVVCRDHLGRIRTFPFPAGSPTTIADSVNGFTVTGTQPGISSDGNVVAFFGNRGNGEGIFASFSSPFGTQLVRIAGEGLDGFTDFDDNDRVGVTSQGVLPSVQGTTVVFDGTNAGKAGVYTVTFSVFDVGGSLNFLMGAPKFVAGTGSAVSNVTVSGGTTQALTKTISSVSLYDPIANNGTLAFHASFNDGSEGIVRAKPEVDTDGDGLYDSWETTGLDFDGNGVIDLDLAALGAKPDHKDVFVEVDGMVARAPLPAVLDRVVLAFSLAPNALVNNPDGQDGVTLHYQLDATTLPIVNFPSPWIEFDALKAAQFGTATERLSANAANILGAKRLAFRYCIFGDQIMNTGFSGIAELPGNDFIVSLGTFTIAGGTDDQQAATFMHELGHTLNLGHGGSDGVNFKPNYHSIMSYTWQMPKPFLPDWGLVYSVRAFNTLDEANLDEHVGIGGTAGVLTWVGPPGPIGGGRFLDEARKANWDGDGTPNEVGVTADLSRVSTPKAAGIQQLDPFVDWPALQYDFRGSPDFADGDHATSNNVIEITSAEHAQDEASCPTPTTYCTAKVNSQGCTPSLTFSGSTSLSGPDDFVVRVDQVLNHTRGVILWSKQSAIQPFGGGFLCVVGPKLRSLPIGKSGGTPPPTIDCSGSYTAPFTHAYMSSKGIAAGEVIYAQCWSRDRGFQKPDDIGLSEGLAFYVCP